VVPEQATVTPNLVIDKLDDPDPVSTEGILLYTLRVQIRERRLRAA
jgi:hypothetical protein